MHSRSERALRIYLDHGEAYGNLGDEAMLLNAVRRIRARLGDCEFVVPCQARRPVPAVAGARTVAPPRLLPAALADRLGGAGRLARRVARRVPWDGPWRYCLERSLRGKRKLAGPGESWLARLRECDAVYCVGAANMNDTTRRGPLLLKRILVDAARRHGIPVVCSSQALGPLEVAWAREVAVETVRAASHFSLRDRGPSRRLLAAAGVSMDAAPEVGDEAFSLPAGSHDAASRLLGEAGIDGSRPFGILHFRSTDYLRPTDCHYPVLAAALDSLAAETQVAFLPMSYGYRVAPDALCGDSVRRLMRRPDTLRLLACPSDPRTARRLVAMSSWVVSLSYHLQVFALGECVPVLPLVSGAYYRQKAEGLCGWTDGRMPCVDLASTSAGELGSAIRRLESQADAHRAVLSEAAAHIGAVNEQPVEALARALGR